ncbi:unnamed protein product [Acanthoscelides obtectus]|uniref:Sodium/bile acid cotransporter 7 n=1 Tax=Acanthoscelides obtectus TaxID=200917 RepID=A0A9P0LAM1_ACAOB|nr:unnamed protein product [Acanthoscelides obtectus]CAK1649247.1 Sodium/bile acid cotransporter 7 [Acanthoscelides obtectus]
MKHRITPARFLQKNWLLVGILGCIFVAAIYPDLGSKQGPLRTEYSVKYGAVFIIFLISGLSLQTEDIFSTLQQLKLHLFIQLYTFLFIPVFTQAFVWLLSFFGIHSWVLKGLITVACMPPPVSSAVILTRTAHGNETAAIFNSVVGSFLLGSTTIVPLLGTVIQLIITVLVPLSLGQAVKSRTNLRGQRLPLNTIGQSALLFVIYTTFCDTFLVPETGLSAMDVIFTVFSVLILQISLMFLSFKLANRLRRYFSPQDIIAIMFCSTHKSLTLGIPILRIMFHGYSHLSQISLPLLVYHPTQIILGGLLVSQMKDWVYSQKTKRPPV